MRIDKLNDDWNKAKNKEELVELLQGYKGILSNNILNYLASLIELEFSVIKNYIDENDRIKLSELEIYKKVAIFNIYNRTKYLLSKKNNEFMISGNNDRRCGLTVSKKLITRRIKLFDFDYKEIHSDGWNKPKIPDGFKTMNIGNISLFQTQENQYLRKIELDKVMNTLERLYTEKNPYSAFSNIVGGPGTDWAIDHANKMQKYEERLKKLTSKIELSEEDKKEIEITSEVHNLILEDFGLTIESFTDKSKLPFNIDEEESKLKKTLIKKMPNLTITDNIKYI